MDIIITKHITGTTIVKPKGRFDASAAPGARERINELLSHNNAHLVIDLAETTFMDSAAMAVLVSLLKHTRYVDGDTKLVWPIHPAARRILHLTRFDRVFDMADTVDEAIERFCTTPQLRSMVTDKNLI